MRKKKKYSGCIPVRSLVLAYELDIISKEEYDVSMNIEQNLLIELPEKKLLSILCSLYANQSLMKK